MVLLWEHEILQLCASFSVAPRFPLSRFLCLLWHGVSDAGGTTCQGVTKAAFPNLASVATLLVETGDLALHGQSDQP